MSGWIAMWAANHVKKPGGPVVCPWHHCALTHVKVSDAKWIKLCVMCENEKHETEQIARQLERKMKTYCKLHPETRHMNIGDSCPFCVSTHARPAEKVWEAFIDGFKQPFRMVWAAVRTFFGWKW